MKKNFLDSDVDYWQVSRTIKDLYLSDGSVNSLLDFERVLDEIDIYAFKNWDLGELVQGPTIGRYAVTCTFLWLEESMPDPRGAKRLLPFDCTVKYKKSVMKIPIKVMTADDFIEGTKKPKIVEKNIWLVEITMPKDLITDIQTGSTELEGQDIDLDDLNLAYEQDLNKEGTEQEV
jgi:hypothetical protein